MKNRFAFLLSSLACMQLAHADFISGGQVTRFHSTGERFGVYLSGTTGCPDGWYYSYRTDYPTPEDYKVVLAVALTAYAQDRKISIFYGTAGCTAKRFVSIDTQE